MLEPIDGLVLIQGDLLCASTFKRGLYSESVEEQTEALEFNGTHHQAHCLLEVSYEDGNPPRLISISLKVLR